MPAAAPLSSSHILNWYKRFQEGDFDVSDREPCGRPGTASIAGWKLLPDGKTTCSTAWSYSSNCFLSLKGNGKDSKRSNVGATLKLFHDNARPHVGKPVKDTLIALGWEVLPHPVYSPDISPTDFHLFRKMQNELSDVRFKTFKEVQKWVDDFLALQDETFFVKGIRELPKRWLKVIESDGDCFDQ